LMAQRIINLFITGVRVILINADFVHQLSTRKMTPTPQRDTGKPCLMD
jgi:hypothetical protein